MKKSLLTLIGLFMGFVYTLNAQQIIHFYDESTWQPIAGVHVSVNNQILVSDQQGNISVNELFSSTMLSISHSDFESITMSYSLIMEKKIQHWFKIKCKYL